MSRKRILANVQDRRTGEAPEAPPEEEPVSSPPPHCGRNEAAGRILSSPVKSKSKKSRARKPQGRSTTQIVVLAIIGIGGIAAIIGLRYLGEAFGVNWVGD